MLIPLPLKTLNQLTVAEIHRHKWFESEKVGYDIGANSAGIDWVDRYYEVWLKTLASQKSVF